MTERREWILKLRDEIDGPQAGTCPVCYINAENLIEDHQRQIERLRGALMLISGQENTKFYTKDDPYPSLYLDADEKMRQIARNALKAEGWDKSE